MEFFLVLEPWHWLSLGMLVLILEVFGSGGFLLGIGIAALLNALLLFLFPALAWYVQFVIFAFMSVVITVVYWKRFRNFNDKTEQPLLNSRMARLIGRSASLLTPIENGMGKVQIEDALWTVTCDEDLAQGVIVNIVGVDGTTLLVKQHIKPVIDAQQSV